VGWHPAGLPSLGPLCNVSIPLVINPSIPLPWAGFLRDGIPPRAAIPWPSLQRFYTTCSHFDPAPLAELGIASSTRSSRLAHASTSAPNVCLSEPSLFGLADLKASAGAPRQSRRHQHLTPLAVRSSSDNIKLSPHMKVPVG